MGCKPEYPTEREVREQLRLTGVSIPCDVRDALVGRVSLLMRRAVEYVVGDLEDYYGAIHLAYHNAMARIAGITEPDCVWERGVPLEDGQYWIDWRDTSCKTVCFCEVIDGKYYLIASSVPYTGKGVAKLNGGDVMHMVADVPPKPSHL